MWDCKLGNRLCNTISHKWGITMGSSPGENSWEYSINYRIIGVCDTL